MLSDEDMHTKYNRDHAAFRYVDDIEVARDESVDLEPSEGNLLIGAGAGLEDGSFFSGLVDEIRSMIEPLLHSNCKTLTRRRGEGRRT